MRLTVKNSRGFTLMEIMVVLGILGMVMGLAIPKIKKSNSNIKSVMREISVLSIETRVHARLKNATYRIVFTMQGKKQTYHVESSNHEVKIQSESTLKYFESLSKEDKPNSPFQNDTSFLKKEQDLPEALFFKSIETSTHSEPITKGDAYIYYSPDGLVDQAVVQVTDGKDLTWSLIFNPLTGHADLIPKAVTLKDLEVR